MIKQFVLALGFISLMMSCGENAAYKIDGKLSNLQDSVIYAVFENDDSKLVDTVMCNKDGQFKIEQKRDSFLTMTLFFENKTRKITTYLEPKKKISITGDALYPSLIHVKGGHINEDLSLFRKEVGGLLKERDELIAQVKKTAVTDEEAEQPDVVVNLTNMNRQLEELALDYILKNPQKQASVVLIDEFFANTEDTRKLDELLATLNPELKNFNLVKELERYSAKSKRTLLGAEAPDFSVKNVYGKSVSLDSFPQEYLLLTFTAPWCDMCRTDHLLLDEIAKKYKNKLEQLLISLDDKPVELRKLLAKDSIKWNLVADSAGQAAMLLDLYNVSALPRCFLIDEEGKIILKTDNGLDIKRTLERLIE